MAEPDALAQMLARRQPQDLDALGASLPARTDKPAFFGPDAQANPWRRTLEAPFRELQWAMMYPVRVADRYAAKQRAEGNASPGLLPPRADGSLSGDLYPFLADQLRPSLGAINAIDPRRGSYPPGRESDNVEVRPRSVWSYQ